MTSETYSLQENVPYWGVSITDIDDNLVIGVWHAHMNLEKFENGNWTRQGILNDAWLARDTASGIMAAKNNGITIGGMGMTSKLWKEGLSLLSPLQIPVKDIFPNPTPGQYRFIFYISVETDNDVEYRKYYIPFEVTE